MRQKSLPAALCLTAVLAGCHRDRVRGLDASPDVPPVLEFGLIPVNQPKVVPLSFSNTGALSLSLVDSQVDEPFGVDGMPDPVDPGASSQVLVTFYPLAPGDVTGTLTLVTSSLAFPTVSVQLHGAAFAPSLSLSADRLDFGDVGVGAQKTLTFQVANAAPVPLNPEVQPQEKGTDYSIAPTGSLGELLPGAAATVTVSFAPGSPGEKDSSVLLSCPVCPTRQILVAGNGVGAAPPPPPDAGPPAPDAGPPPPEALCVLSAAPGRLDFDTLRPGESARQTVVLSSTGTATCFVQTPYLAAGSDPSFSASPLQALQLQPGETATLPVTFAPGSKTALQTTGSLVLVSNDKVSSPLSVPLTGAVEVPPPPPPPPPPGLLVVAPQSLSFTAEAGSATPDQTLLVHNAGGSSLSWTAHADDAAIALAGAPGVLAAGADSTITVWVAAQAVAGARSQSIVVDAGSAGVATVPVHITFTAQPPPPPAPAALVVTPASLHFVAQVPSAPTPQTVTLSNSGGQSLSWTASNDDPGVSVSPAAGTLAGGASAFATVAVAAAPYAGTRISALTFSAGAAGKQAVTLTMDFTAPPPPPPPPQYGSSAWPKWHHGNTNTGLSQIDTSRTAGALVWKTFVSPPVPCLTDARTDGNKRCGTYVSSPVLAADGSVIQLGGDGNVVSLDRATGKKKWSTQTAPPWLSANEGTPTVVADGSIFVMTAGESFARPQFYKLDKDGNVIWHNAAGGACGGKKCDGFDSSPALADDGTLYLADDDRSRVVAFDQRGTELGHVVLDPPSDLETQSGALAPDDIGYWAANGKLWALTPAKQLWSFADPDAAKVDDFNKPPYGFHNIKSAPAVTADGKVIFTYSLEQARSLKFATRVYAFQAGNTARPLWKTQLGYSAAVKGLPSGPGLADDDPDALRYRSGISSPAIGSDGTIYVGHVDGLFAIDSATGKVKWGQGMSEIVGSPAVGADGTVYVGSMNGFIYALSPKGDVRWKYKTGGQVNSSPAIGADGTVYAMSDDGFLYAIK